MPTVMQKREVLPTKKSGWKAGSYRLCRSRGLLVFIVRILAIYLVQFVLGRETVSYIMVKQTTKTHENQKY